MAMTTTGYTITNAITSWLFFCLYKEDRGQVKINFLEINSFNLGKLTGNTKS